MASFVILLTARTARIACSDRHTDTQNDYCNPRCACAPRVNDKPSTVTLAAHSRRGLIIYIFLLPSLPLPPPFSPSLPLPPPPSLAPFPVRYGDKVHLVRIDGDLLTRELPAPEIRRNFVMVCGTQSFVSDMLSYLKALGYTEDMIFIF